MHVTLPVDRARWRDIDWIVDLVTATAVPTTLAAWLVPDERRRAATIAAVARIWIEHALLFGDAFLLKDGTAATVWFHRYRPIPPPPRYDDRLDDACGAEAARFRRLDHLLAARRPEEPHNHLAFLAAPPDAARTAQAAAVLAGSHRWMDNLGLPAYTEVHDSADLGLYRRLGYRGRRRVSRPDGAAVDLLWRPVPSVRLRGPNCPTSRADPAGCAPAPRLAVAGSSGGAPAAGDAAQRARVDSPLAPGFGTPRRNGDPCPLAHGSGSSGISRPVSWPARAGPPSARQDLHPGIQPPAASGGSAGPGPRRTAGVDRGCYQ
ncbi:hypothetical protein [Micromonospora tarapacensis]|uniref:hypothetical protein n=1 Tax=Micromonospora tarapacensis TaxID=2835305 RepID=UPI001E325B1D|nr:hypothetical protein [Micromonospora tarapacensis]